MLRSSVAPHTQQQRGVSSSAAHSAIKDSSHEKRPRNAKGEKKKKKATLKHTNGNHRKKKLTERG